MQSPNPEFGFVPGFAVRGPGCHRGWRRAGRHLARSRSEKPHACRPCR